MRDPTVGNAQGYSTLSRLRSDKDAARDAVVAEFVRASAALSRAKAIAAALDLENEIDELRDRIDAFRHIIENKDNGDDARN